MRSKERAYIEESNKQAYLEHMHAHRRDQRGVAPLLLYTIDQTKITSLT